MNPMAAPLSEARCFLHPQREAVARCPDCRRYFCRECVTEHAGRVLCTDCLASRTQPETGRERIYGGLRALIQFLSATVVLWMLFFYLGRILMSVPDSFHEGTIWSGSFWGAAK